MIFFQQKERKKKKSRNQFLSFFNAMGSEHVARFLQLFILIVMHDALGAAKVFWKASALLSAVNQCDILQNPNNFMGCKSPSVWPPLLNTPSTRSHCKFDKTKALVVVRLFVHLEFPAFRILSPGHTKRGLHRALSYIVYFSSHLSFSTTATTQAFCNTRHPVLHGGKKLRVLC